MKQILLITTLLAASSVTAMAIAPFGERFSAGFAGGNIGKLKGTEWDYRHIQENHYASNDSGVWTGNIGYHGAHTTGSHFTGITHYQNQNPTSINLRINARYEFYFEFNLDQSQSGTSGDQAMAGMYLAGSGKSIYFGNAQLDNNGDRRSAVAVVYDADIADYNDDNGQYVYFPNDEFNYKLANAGTYKGDTTNFHTVIHGTTNNNTFDSGTYKLTVIIESFADTSQKDLLYFHAHTPEGTASRQLDFSAMTVSSAQSFDNFGFILHKDGATTASATRMMAYEYSRALKPEEVVPDVPEPSAFGLLAGLGAIALAASRRRRK
ncbi:MAG: PEP-CTERM sorting domain-containing protein [Opitutales bacterium]|nr:PEP-CTERM sorting domain-containing protein [Opitutales bacterium]